MKTLFKFLCVIILLCSGQTPVEAQSKFYAGPGLGLDYGGIGGKLEFLPVKHVGLFGGAGFNFKSLGWNTGLSFKLMPEKKLCPNLVAFYGYNGVSIIWNDPSSHYNMISYGFTFGAGLDIKIGRKGHKMSAGLFVPIREKKFIDNYHEAKNDPALEDIGMGMLLPIAISFGYNFRL